MEIQISLTKSIAMVVHNLIANGRFLMTTVDGEKMINIVGNLIYSITGFVDVFLIFNTYTYTYTFKKVLWKMHTDNKCLNDKRTKCFFQTFALQTYSLKLGILTELFNFTYKKQYAIV